MQEVSGSCPHCGYNPASDRGRYPLALPAGTLLHDRFLTGRVLGQGGFGITYIAWDFEAGCQVAVKEYLPAAMAGRAAGCQVRAYSGQRKAAFLYGRKCFLKEAQTLAAFAEHPNIIHVRGQFEENGTAYFVMEYIDGVSFQDYIQAHGGKLAWQPAAEMLYPVMAALEAVHEKGIIHRDVTPDNIFVTKQGSVKLLDFGAARYSSGDRSQSLDVVLKHGFAPKEQYTRHGRQGAYTDVYTLAATFYYAVTGKIPPDSIERTEHECLAAPSALGICLPAAVEQALLKAMEVRPDGRYQSVREFRRAVLQETEENPDRSGQETDAVRPAEAADRFVHCGKKVKKILDKRKKKRKKQRLVRAAAVICVLCLLRALVPEPHVSFLPTAGVSGSNRNNSPNTEGNSIENIAQAGMAAEDSRYRYVATVNGLLREEKETGERVILEKDYANNLNVYHGRIYYLASGSIWRMRRDGSRRRKVLEREQECFGMYIADGTAYLIYEEKPGSGGYTLLCADIRDWSLKEAASGLALNGYTISGGWVYYRDTADGWFYKKRTDGTGAKMRLSKMYVSSPIEADGWIYGYTPQNSICRIAADGNRQETVCKNFFPGNIAGMNVKAGRIYCYSGYRQEEKGVIASIRLDGTGLRNLYTAAGRGEYFYCLNFLERNIVVAYCKADRMTGTVSIDMDTGRQISYTARYSSHPAKVRLCCEL